MLDFQPRYEKVNCKICNGLREMTCDRPPDRRIQWCLLHDPTIPEARRAEYQATWDKAIREMKGR